jgi:outer membrane protein OmpA-like peptidoglycan-associated protein/tetratricopeptide (TPR) repeat protein
MKTIPKLIHATALTVIFSLVFHFAFSQKAQLKEINVLYDHLEYNTAIIKYEELLKKHPDVTEAKIKLADCYRMTGRSEKAEFWYYQVVKSPEVKPIHKFYYGQALMNNGKYNLAESWIREYHQSNPTDKRAELALKSIENLPVYFKDTASYFVYKLLINSPNADFCPVFYNTGIVFASARETKQMVQRTHSWTGQPFLNLYYSHGKGNTFLEVEPFDKNIQIKYNDGPVCFSKDGKEIYVTRNNVEGHHTYESSDQVVKLRIVNARNENGTWKETDKFKYNNNDFNCAHPSLSPDGKRLFFSSDMPGGFGGMDLYVCDKDSSGWGHPQNMGEKINTAGNELFPYLHEDGTFLYSSNGRDGLGGLDVYWCKLQHPDSIVVKNMGAPINSSYDDFGIIFDNNTHYGYYSTNRESKNTDDDMYSFRRMIKLKGVVVEKGTDIPIAGATVVLKNKTKGELEVKSDTTGKFEFPIDYNQEYTVEASKADWTRDIAELNTINYFPTEDLYRKLQLEKNARVFQLIVKVIDKDTKKPIAKANIGLDQTETTLGLTNKDGKYMEPLKRDLLETLIVTANGYQPKVVALSNIGRKVESDFEVTVELKKGEDVGEFARWYKIVYYDFDKSNIRGSEAKTMMEVLQFVQAHPEVRLLMNSYCDSRGTNAYNQKLSQRRAESATKWLTNNGMDRGVVEKMEWAGETMLMNKCADGSKCSEEDHALNRRTEIRVIRVEKGLSRK